MAAGIEAPPAVIGRGRRWSDRFGDAVLYGVTALAALASILLVGSIVWKVLEGSWPAVKHFGIPFIWSSDWNPVLNKFGALEFIIGTLVTGGVAVLIAAPL